jgi:hypothetical protein
LANHNNIRRIWSEFVPYEELRSSRVLSLLKPSQVQLLVAVRPDNLPNVGELVRHYRSEGLALGMWPMLDDVDGRWGSTFNADLYRSFVLRVADACEGMQAMALDLEPPIVLLRRLLRGDPRAFRALWNTAHRSQGKQELLALVQELESRELTTIAALHPVLLGDQKGNRAWQELLGTPFADLPFQSLSFMAYTSLIEGYSRGLLGRRVATTMLAQTARSASRQWGARASLSLGSVGGGALGDERPYRSVEQLREDVSIALACGIEDLALFDLSGVLAKPHPEEWLQTFVNTPPSAQAPPSSLRARILRSAAKSASGFVGDLKKLNQW